MLRAANERRSVGVLVTPTGAIIDLPGHRILHADRDAPLTLRESQLLAVLASRLGTVFTRQDLVELVSGSHDRWAARTLDVYVLRLRNKLGDTHASCIQTVRKVGYRLNAIPRP